MKKHKPIVYISGKMSGLLDHGFAAFSAAAAQLRKMGYEVLNPAENDGGSKDKSWEFYMSLDIPNVVKSDFIVLLDNNWDTSRGATLELVIAEALKKPIYDYIAFVDIGIPAKAYENESWLLKPINKKTLRTAHKATEAPENIAEEADRLVNGDRNASYGHPLTDYECTAALWSAIIGHKVTPKQAILCMIAVKLSRESRKHKRDNLVDICGYALCADMVEERLAERAAHVGGCMGDD
jgi:hypothetical protein